MDILGSILAYLGCMAAVVGAMLISFTVFFSAPDKAPEQTTFKHPSAMAAQAAVPKMTAQPAVRKVAATPAGKSTAAIAQHNTQDGNTHEHEAASAAEAKPNAAAARTRMQAARAQKWRRYTQEDRARRWAYQQDPDFTSRFLGYAD